MKMLTDGRRTDGRRSDLCTISSSMARNNSTCTYWTGNAIIAHISIRIMGKTSKELRALRGFLAPYEAKI